MKHVKDGSNAETFLFDTYGLICLVRNVVSYQRFSESVVLTTQFNLVELYYSLLSRFGEGKAKKVCGSFKQCVVDVGDEVIFDALKFRLGHKKKNPRSNLSYVDCISYMTARSKDVLFVTGDREFERLKGVDFVRE